MCECGAAVNDVYAGAMIGAVCCLGWCQAKLSCNSGASEWHDGDRNSSPRRFTLTYRMPHGSTFQATGVPGNDTFPKARTRLGGAVFRA